MIDRVAREAAIAQLAARGYRRDHAFGLVMMRARPRMDVKPGPQAQMMLYQLALARKHETVARRRRLPRQIYPTGIEAQYAARLVGIVQSMREVYARLVRELPKLLARIQESRVDDALSPFADDNAAAYPALVEPVLEKEHVAGLEIAIENRAGTTRTWIDSNGERGETLMRYSYGFIVGAIGADGEDVDVYIGPEPEPDEVYVIHQNSKASGFEEYDEDKVMLGWRTAYEAKAAYLAQYNDPRFFRGISVFTLADFTARLRSEGYVQFHESDIPREAIYVGMLAHRADANEFDFARRLISEAGDEMRKIAKAGNAEKLAAYFARSTSQAQRRELARQLKAGLGIDVLTDERFIPQTIEYFTHENASLIGSIPEDLHRDVAQLTARAFSKRMKPETFAALLEERFQIAENRARFIARDQLGKLWGQVNAVRQRGLGIDEYWWRTRRDHLVRPSHAKLESKRMRYDDPPPFGLPGEDFGCRCEADPILEGLLDQAAAMAGHAAPVGLGM